MAKVPFNMPLPSIYSVIYSCLLSLKKLDTIVKYPAASSGA
jgi:hypothetical protein